jgi:PEGA domain
MLIRAALLVTFALQGLVIQAQDSKPRIFVTDSTSWEISGGFSGASSGGNAAVAGRTSGGARPQTVEIIKTFNEHCTAVTVTMDRTNADYVVLLDHEGGKGYARKDNKIAVFHNNGDLLQSGSTRSLGNAVKDACEAIQMAPKPAASRLPARLAPATLAPPPPVQTEPPRVVPVTTAPVAKAPPRALTGSGPSVTTSSVPARAITSNDNGASLNNDDVVALKKAGYSDDLIVWRIEASAGSFRLDTQSMIDLKNTGLSDEVIRAMTKASKAQNDRPAAEVAVAKPTPAVQTTDAKVAIAKPEIVSPSSSAGGITVRFTSTPSNAEIDVDGNYWGSTPTADLKRLQAGTHTITVRKSGYKPWERKIELVAGDDRTVNAELEVDPTKPRVSGLN